jgi:hypothetical protein
MRCEMYSISLMPDCGDGMLLLLLVATLCGADLSSMNLLSDCAPTLQVMATE